MRLICALVALVTGGPAAAAAGEPDSRFDAAGPLAEFEPRRVLGLMADGNVRYWVLLPWREWRPPPPPRVGVGPRVTQQNTITSVRHLFSSDCNTRHRYSNYVQRASRPRKSRQNPALADVGATECTPTHRRRERRVVGLGYYIALGRI